MAVVTMGNCPNTDILVSNKAGTKFVHVQVKTFVPGIRTCSVGMKAERDFGPNFFWVLAGIPEPEQAANFIYYVIPSAEMANHIKADFKIWAETPGTRGQPHDSTTTVRAVTLPPEVSLSGWDLTPFENRWDLIQDKLQ